MIVIYGVTHSCICQQYEKQSWLSWPTHHHMEVLNKRMSFISSVIYWGWNGTKHLETALLAWNMSNPRVYILPFFPQISCPKKSQKSLFLDKFPVKIMKIGQKWAKNDKNLNFIENFPFLSQFSWNFPPLSGGKFGRIYIPAGK